MEPSEGFSVKDSGKYFNPQGCLEVNLVGSQKPPVGKFFSVKATHSEMDSDILRRPRPQNILPRLPSAPASTFMPSGPAIDMRPVAPVSQERRGAKSVPLVQPNATAPRKPEAKTMPVGPAIDVSTERLVFLERVEKVMACEQRISELEGENHTLSRMLARLQNEVDEAKAAVKI